jgi:uncharacterized protein (DUF1778 family)
MQLRKDRQDQRTVIRFTKTEKRFITKAALRGGYRTLSDFVREKCLKAAKTILAENEHPKHTLGD